MKPQSTCDINLILETAREAALKAGVLISEIRSSSSMTIDYKAMNEIVTSADMAAECLILERIKARFPDHAVISEETSPATPAHLDLYGPVWLVDPIDGTTNFARGHTHSAISIAFALEGKVQAAVVHAPFQAETFEAARHQGATLNGKAIHSSSTDNLKNAIVATGFVDRVTPPAIIMQRLSRILEHCRDIRRNGAASLDACWVACGRLDSYYESVKPWDIAAGSLIAREAGAVTGHINELPSDIEMPAELYSRDFLTAAPGVFAAVRELLR